VLAEAGGLPQKVGQLAQSLQQVDEANPKIVKTEWRKPQWDIAPSLSNINHCASPRCPSGL
jgi:hypothetical protein